MVMEARKTNGHVPTAKGPHQSGGLSRNPGGDLLSQGGTPKYHRRWWA